MEITWYGMACFRLRSRALTIVTDPFDSSLGLSMPRLRADIVTVSHEVPGHNNVPAVRGYEHVFNGPGEYEVNGVFVNGVATHHRGEVGQRQRNTAFLFEFDDLAICHLGDLGVLPDRDQVELLSGADVLLLPVGGGDILDAAKAVEVVTELEPKIVIPMHYALPSLTLKLADVDRFLKEMGVPRPDPVSLIKLTRSDLTSEEPQVILLDVFGAGE